MEKKKSNSGNQETPEVRADRKSGGDMKYDHLSEQDGVHQQ